MEENIIRGIGITREYVRRVSLPFLIKWPGGKSREIKNILSGSMCEILPDKIKQYYEPFVGGGAFYLNINADSYFINDTCTELICFYNLIRDKNDKFFDYLVKIQKHWDFIRNIINDHDDSFYKYFIVRDFKNLCHEVDKIAIILSFDFDKREINTYKNIIVKTVYKKIRRIMKVEENSEKKLSNKNFLDNIEGAFKASFYTYLRDKYNKRKLQKSLYDCDAIHISLFYFLRDNCYSSMFRYNSDGMFNVPYGGISYNEKNITSRFSEWKDENLIKRLKNTIIENMDFYDFLKKHLPQKNDFIFVDPPYDSEFSTYDQNIFGKPDHKRLANYLLNECHGNWLQIIKNTNFIYNLYSDAEKNKKIRIVPFDKTYSVSFRNRNERKVEHLAIFNY